MVELYQRSAGDGTLSTSQISAKAAETALSDRFSWF